MKEKILFITTNSIKKVEKNKWYEADFNIKFPIKFRRVANIDFRSEFGYQPNIQVYVEKIRETKKRFPLYMMERRTDDHEYYKIYSEKFNKRFFRFWVTIYFCNGKTEKRELKFKNTV